MERRCALRSLNTVDPARPRRLPGVGARLAALSLGACLMGQQGCPTEPPPSQLDGLLFGTDYLIGVIRVTRPDTREIVYEYNVRTANPDRCAGARAAACTVMGFEHTYRDGENFIDVNMMFPGGRGEIYSEVQRIKIGAPDQKVWAIERLSYEGVPNAEDYCPSRKQEEGTCRMASIIGLEVIEDRPDLELVKVIVTDDQMIVQISLDYSGGNSTGQVDWVLGRFHSDWPEFGYPNTVTYIDDEPGGPYVLNTFLYSELEPSEITGKIYLWRRTSAGWEVAWTFPEQGYLYYPHMAELLVEPLTGEKRIYYNHSEGNDHPVEVGMAPGQTGGGGTFGVLLPGEPLSEPPLYFFEAIYHAGSDVQKTRFTHDVDVLEDGTMLLSEAASEFSALRGEGRISHVRPFEEPPLTTAGLSGAYSPDGSTQNIVAMPDSNIFAEFTCGYQALYETQLVPMDQIGPFLLTAQTLELESCGEKIVNDN